MRNATQKEIDNFIEYRANHVALVQRIGSVVFGIDISDHDKDKIEANGEELNLFSLRNSMLNGTYHPHKADRAKLKRLVGKHVKSQKHHPEYWDDSITARNFDDENPPQVNAHKMPKRYLLEMVCDWCAVALKLNKPLFNWYNKTCIGENARFLFTDNQKEYIIECISRVASKIKEENLHYPKIEYTAELDSPKIDFGKKLKESKEDKIYSKEFKDWFGDWENDPEHSSKVVDKDGKPLAVYHGSFSLFDSFDPNKGHNVPAIWHADRLSIASHWSNTSDIHRSPKVVEEFENLKSLVKELESKDTPFEEVVKKISDFTEENFDTEIKSDSSYTSIEDCKEYNLDPERYEGISYGYNIIYNNGMETGGNVRKDLHKYYETLMSYVESMVRNSSRDYINYYDGGFLYKNYLNIRKPLIVDAKDEPYHNIRYRGEYYNTESLAMYAKERGYDGVIIKNVYETDYENKKGTDYIVFNPNQIKSATDNNGNFSKESDNMYESRSLLDMSTEEVINLVEEPIIYRKSFKEWFGDWENDPKNSSKMIGRNGKPKVFYHGTNKKFDTFSTDMIGSNTGELGWYGKGFYFTTDYLMARHYGSKVLEVYLNIRHPFYIDSNNLRRYKDELGLTDLDLYRTDPARIFKNNKKSVKLSELLIKDGYDGIIYSEDGVSWSEVVVFNPNQIKATDNEGLDKEYFKHINENEEKGVDTKESSDVESTTVNEKVITSFGGKVPISNKDKDQILKFCKKAVEDGMKPTKYTEEDMSNSANFSSGSIASNAPENTLKVINLGAEKIEEAFVICSLDGQKVEGTYTTDLNKAKEMRNELADTYKTFFKIDKVSDIPNSENTEEFKESTEKGKTCVFTFGRYQPPTKGHLKVWKKVGDTEGDAHYIYTSHTKDKKKNPLDYNTKVGLIKSALKENNINAEVVESEAKTIIDVVVDIANKGFTDIIFVGGSDRLNDIVTLIQKYNDVPNKEGNSYHFDTIEGVSAGERDPDSDSLEGISGTKIRQFALDNDFESFKNNLAFSDESTAKEVMEIIKSNIK